MPTTLESKALHSNMRCKNNKKMDKIIKTDDWILYNKVPVCIPCT